MPTITASAAMDWNAEGPSTAVLLVRAAHAPGQRVLDEHLDIDGADVEKAGPRADNGARPLRLHARAGAVRLRYEATIALAPEAVRADAPLPTLADLDLGLLSWTLPSRYCPSDVLAATAQHLFGAGPHTGALLERVRGWVEANIAYVPGTSDVHTAADETLLRRTGVCRDLAHLAAALLRGVGVPARLVGGYALDLEPQDFHALVEAHDGAGWRLLDATGLAPVETVARVATGRDATEIAWGTTAGPLALQELAVAVRRA